MTTAILAFSLLLEVAAAAVSLQLVAVTGRRTTWALIAGALFVIAVHTGVMLAVTLSDSAPPPLPLAAQLVSFLIPVLLLLGILGIRRMFLEQRRTNLALRGRERHLTALLTNVPVVLFSVDRLGVFNVVEGLAPEALGLRPERALGRSAFDLFQDYPGATKGVKRPRFKGSS